MANLARRIGVAPGDRSGLNLSQMGQCPDIFRVEGDATADLNLQGTEGMRNGPIYFVVGTLLTSEQTQIYLDTDASVAPYEATVALPEEVFHKAVKQLIKEGLIQPPAPSEIG